MVKGVMAVRMAVMLGGDGGDGGADSDDVGW